MGNIPVTYCFRMTRLFNGTAPPGDYTRSRKYDPSSFFPSSKWCLPCYCCKAVQSRPTAKTQNLPTFFTLSFHCHSALNDKGNKPKSRPGWTPMERWVLLVFPQGCVCHNDILSHLGVIKFAWSECFQIEKKQSTWNIEYFMANPLRYCFSSLEKAAQAKFRLTVKSGNVSAPCPDV